MKILFAAAEAAPFIKVGGLGDVIQGLPKELVKKGVDARVVLPMYSSIDQKMREGFTYITNITVSNSWRSNYCGIFTTKMDGVTYYFIDNEQYFKRDSIYGNYDDGEIFAFFSRAVLDILPIIDFFPDIINVNDWHTSTLPVYLNAFYRQKVGYENIKTVLSIHNIEFQGKFDPYNLGQLFGLDLGIKEIMMYDGDINVLKAGIESADRVVTVSRKYAEEILEEENSFGLHNILRPRRDKLCGIVNGIDLEVFSPESDKNIKTNYSKKTIQNKRYNKLELQKQMALEENPNIPIIGMVSRLTEQKGFDLFYEVMDEISALDVQIIILGTGEERYESLLHDWENRCYDKVRGVVTFSPHLASMIYAGADMLLMPSKAEPCGLSQLIAMRYGTVPIVHTVGGLYDTVEAYNPETKKGNGITFQSFNSYDMLDAIKRAIVLYGDKESFKKIRRNAMERDSGWDRSAEEYIKFYEGLI